MIWRAITKIEISCHIDQDLIDSCLNISHIGIKYPVDF